MYHNRQRWQRLVDAYNVAWHAQRRTTDENEQQRQEVRMWRLTALMARMTDRARRHPEWPWK